MSASRTRRVDITIGIVLGLVLGIVVVVVFVFFSSRDAIDAPSIDQHPAESARSAGDR